MKLELNTHAHNIGLCIFLKLLLDQPAVVAMELKLSMVLYLGK